MVYGTCSWATWLVIVCCDPVTLWAVYSQFYLHPVLSECPWDHQNTRAENQKHQSWDFFFVVQQFSENNWPASLLSRCVLLNYRPPEASPGRVPQLLLRVLFQLCRGIWRRMRCIIALSVTQAAAVLIISGKQSGWGPTRRADFSPVGRARPAPAPVNGERGST